MTAHADVASSNDSARVELPGGRVHIAVLDGIRGVAVVLVVFYHYTTLTPSTTMGHAWQQFIRGCGWMGVDLFFVLSGYLITGILLKAKDRPSYFKNFYARRALRIFPLYYGYLAFVIFVAPWIDSRFDTAERAGADLVWYWCYLQNYAIAQYHAWPHSMLLNHLWSLAVEEQFYLAWPLLVFVCPRRLFKYVCLATLAGSCGLRLAAIWYSVPGLPTPLSLYVSTPCRLDGLALGAFLAAWQASQGSLHSLRRPAICAVVGAITACSLVASWQGNFHYNSPGTASVGFLAVAIGFAGLLTLAVTAPRDSLTATFFSAWWLRQLGKFCYAIYVFHLLVALVASQLVKQVPDVLGAQATFYAVSLPLLLVVSIASWYLYEVHFLRLKRYFE